MEYENDAGPEATSIARCREILGTEAIHLSDEEVEAIRRHAETFASVVISLFVAERSSPSR